MKLQDWLTETKAICDAATADNIFTTYESMRTALPLALQVIVKLAKALEQISLHEQGLKVARANEALAEVEELLAKNQGDE